MDKQNQITFEFSNEDKPGDQEFLSGHKIESAKKTKSSRGRKSLKELEGEHEMIQIPEDEVLFQKQYYAIGEVAEMFRVNTSLLRFWEGEFNMNLRKNRKGDRFFTPTDVKSLELIYDLLRRRKFTIEGAKDYLKKNKQANEKYIMIQSLQRLRAFLLQLKAGL